MKTKRELARARVAREAAAATGEAETSADCDQTLPIIHNGDQVESEKIVSDGPEVSALSEVTI